MNGSETIRGVISTMISLRSIVSRLLPERRADAGQVAQERNLRGRGRQVFANQAADDDRAAVGAQRRWS